MSKERVTSIEHTHKPTGEVFTVAIEYSPTDPTETDAAFPTAMAVLPERDGKALCLDCDRWIARGVEMYGHPEHESTCRYAKPIIRVSRENAAWGGIHFANGVILCNGCGEPWVTGERHKCPAVLEGLKQRSFSPWGLKQMLDKAKPWERDSALYDAGK